MGSAHRQGSYTVNENLDQLPGLLQAKYGTQKSKLKMH